MYIAAATVIGIGLAYSYGSSTIDKNEQSPTGATTGRLEARAKPLPQPAPASATSSTSPTRTTETPERQTIGDLLEKLKIPDPLDIINNPDKWIAAAKSGDPQAAIGIYNTLSNCTKFSRNKKNDISAAGPTFSNDCSKLPIEDPADRLIWLQISAEKGDPASQYLYGKFAQGSNLFERTQIPTNEKIANINSNAISWLESAARHGIIEAYSELAQVYMNGNYGVYEAPRAYAYALLSFTKTGQGEELVNELERKLRPNELSEGRLLFDRFKSGSTKK